MNYEEFLNQPTSFLDDMEKLIIIKHKYRLKFTEEEKQINVHLLTYSEEMKLNELRGHFKKCWNMNTENGKGTD